MTPREALDAIFANCYSVSTTEQFKALNILTKLVANAEARIAFGASSLTDAATPEAVEENSRAFDAVLDSWREFVEACKPNTEQPPA